MEGVRKQGRKERGGTIKYGRKLKDRNRAREKAG